MQRQTTGSPPDHLNLHIPGSICRLNELCNLDPSDTPYDVLPEELGILINLQHLDVKRTKITSIPISIRRLRNLESFSATFSRLFFFPYCFVKLPCLRELDTDCSLISYDLDFGSKLPLNCLQNIYPSPENLPRFSQSISETCTKQCLWKYMERKISDRNRHNVICCTWRRGKNCRT